MTNDVSFKVVFKNQGNGGDDELRRFVVEKNLSTSFSHIQEKLFSVFPQLKQKIFAVSWTDEEGDMITIATDEEFLIALKEMQGPVYKLAVSEKDRNNMGSSVPESHVHPGVTCDGCDKGPIIGHRYKCVVCDNYDLCGSCEAAGIHPGHNMIRISNPDSLFPHRLFKRIHKTQESVEKHCDRGMQECRVMRGMSQTGGMAGMRGGIGKSGGKCGIGSIRGV